MPLWLFPRKQHACLNLIAAKVCFVVGPIGDENTAIREHADWLLRGIIMPVMSTFSNLQVKRADHDTRPGLIDVQMINDLLNAELVIADLRMRFMRLAFVT
jgi:hypothetical protein